MLFVSGPLWWTEMSVTYITSCLSYPWPLENIGFIFHTNISTFLCFTCIFIFCIPIMSHQHIFRDCPCTAPQKLFFIPGNKHTRACVTSLPVVLKLNLKYDPVPGGGLTAPMLHHGPNRPTTHDVQIEGLFWLLNESTVSLCAL